MKIERCRPGCSWHIWNSARSFFTAKPERAVAVLPKAALCLRLCFCCRRAMMGCWLPRVAWLKSGCRGWGKRTRPRGSARAGWERQRPERQRQTPSVLARPAAADRCVETSRQRSILRPLSAEGEGSDSSPHLGSGAHGARA